MHRNLLLPPLLLPSYARPDWLSQLRCSITIQPDTLPPPHTHFSSWISSFTLSCVQNFLTSLLLLSVTFCFMRLQSLPLYLYAMRYKPPSHPPLLFSSISFFRPPPSLSPSLPAGCLQGSRREVNGFSPPSWSHHPATQSKTKEHTHKPTSRQAMHTHRLVH